MANQADTNASSRSGKPVHVVLRRIARLLVVIALIIALAAAIVYLARTLPSYGYLFPYIWAGIILVGGVAVSREVAFLFTRELTGRLGSNALVVSNSVQVVGTILSAVAAASYASFSPTAILTSAAFSGLVLGLALQPTLGAFFAGILILISGEMRPGTQVRILSWHIPFQWAFSPDCKYFSPDQEYPGYLAVVTDVGLFFTTVLTEEGQSMKLPNSILATDDAQTSTPRVFGNSSGDVGFSTLCVSCLCRRQQTLQKPLGIWVFGSTRSHSSCPRPICDQILSPRQISLAQSADRTPGVLQD